MSLSINIPEEHYVTFHFRDNDIYPLGFLVPDGTDKAAQKRKATADRWANGSKVKVPAKVFKNKPMVGFEIRKTVQYRSRNSTKETWRIIDPRGFELEISNVNMEFIVDHCMIDKGEIISSCIWGRDGGENLLLPVDCKEYRAASANTERQGKKASMRDVKLGDHVTFKKGSTGRFLGKYFKYNLKSGEYDNAVDAPFCHSSSKYYVFVGPKNDLTISSSVQVSEINKSEPITEAEAEVLANKLVAESNGKYRYSDATVALCAEQVEFDSFTKEKVALTSFEQAAADGFYHSIVSSGTAGQLWYYDNHSTRYGNKDNVSITAIKTAAYDEFKIAYEMVQTSGYYGGNRLNPKRVSIDLKLLESQYTKEGIKFSYKTALGNEIVIKI